METKKCKRKTRRPLAEVQPQAQHVQSVQPEHSTPHQSTASSASLLAEKKRAKQLPMSTDLFGFDEIDSSPPEPAVTPICGEGSVTPTSVMSTSTLNSPVDAGKIGGKVRSYLVKSAFKREDPYVRRRVPEKKFKAKRRLLEKVSLVIALVVLGELYMYFKKT